MLRGGGIDGEELEGEEAEAEAGPDLSGSGERVSSG